jgi:cofilin
MLTTGLQVSDEIIQEFNNLRMKRQHRYLIFKVSDDHQSIVIDQVGPREATFDNFKEQMPQEEPR